MAKEVTFKLNLRVDGKDVVKKVTMDVGELQKAIGNAKTESNKLRDSLIKYNQINETVRSVSDGFAQLSGYLNDVTEESRSFGGAMAAANTMAGKSGQEFANLKDQVSELAGKIPIARDELANGLYQVVSNGVPENNWITFLNKSARASVSGLADLGETVKVTSTIIKNYGLDWEDAESIQDKIQLTAKNGVTSFEQLAQALPRVTSQASTLGVSVDELMATFSTLTGVSGDTAEVSTQLAAIFTALIKPSSEAAEMAQQMGIQFDAASIKAAGGMEQFLVSLDKSVKQYAASSGMLEQEIYGKLFGSAESLRALTPLTGKLAEKFRGDVADMKNSAGTIDKAFEIMSSTGAATLQMLNNKLGKFRDMVQASIGNALPFINFTSQALVTLSATTQLIVSMKSLAITTNLVSVATTAASKAKVAAVAVSRVLQAAFTGEAVGATTAAVATRALGVAVKSLLISTGVGIAIVALTEAINYLMNSSDDAAKSVDNLSEAEQRAKIAHQQTAQQMASVRSEMVQNIATLKNFKGSKEQEKAMVQQMNTKYGEAMGYYSTVSQWYQALTANSKAYCNQMINEITIRNLANQAADLQQQRYDYTHDKNGKVKKFDNRDKIGYVKGEGLQILPGTSQKAEADKVMTNLYRQEQNIKKRMEALVKRNQNISYKHTAGYSATPPTLNTSTGSGGKARGGNAHTGNTPAVTEDKKALEGSIDWYEEQINEKQKELNATADKATARALNAEMEGLQRQLYMLKVDVGIEDVPKVDVKAFAINLKAQLDEEMETMRQRLSDKPLVINTEVEAKARDYDHISSLFNIDVSNFESVRTGLADINGISDSTAKGMAAAGASCEMFGSALQQLGGDSAAAKAGMVAAAIGQFVLSFAQAMSTCKTWIEWLAFGISGTAQLTSIISTISQFATGGIVGGNQTSGDKVLVRVNSGEMILNAAQQARLFAIANGAAVQGVSVNTAGLQGIGSGMSATLGISGRLRGRDIVMAVANETRSNRRRSNIKI